jgi:hypothetical protein
MKVENAAKYQMSDNSPEFVYKKGIEAFNLLNFLSSQLLSSSPGPVKHPQKLFIRILTLEMIIVFV